MKISVYKTDGSKGKDVIEVDAGLLEKKPNEHAMHSAVIAHLANLRQGTSATKTRSMVRGGGRKPYRQKGTGNARAGTNSSPVWRGGGRVFGAHPRDYSVNIPKKLKKLARLSAIVSKLNDNQIVVIEDFDLDTPKTKKFYDILKSLEIEKGKTLFVAGTKSGNIYKSGRNIPNVTMRLADTLSTYDILHCDTFLIQKSAFESLTNSLVSGKSNDGDN